MERASDNIGLGQDGRKQTLLDIGLDTGGRGGGIGETGEPLNLLGTTI